jgi:hypothetical protein
MDDNHDNFMADIIASGTNTIATFTYEECSQADMYLNIPPNEDAAAPVEDTIANMEDNSRNNEESLVNKSIECSHEVYLYLILKQARSLCVYSAFWFGPSSILT